MNSNYLWKTNVLLVAERTHTCAHTHTYTHTYFQTFEMKSELLYESLSCSLPSSFWASRSLSRRLGDSASTPGSSSSDWPCGPGSSWWSERCGRSSIGGWESTPWASSWGIMVVKDMDSGIWTRGEPGRAAEPGANWTPGLGMVDMVVRGWAQGR